MRTHHGLEATMRDKHGKFVELATKRVNKALEQIRLVGNLANRMTYEYTDEEAKKILRALQKEVDSVKSKFDPNAGAEHRFTL